MKTESYEVRVVGIGASAGGIEALREFFDATPANTGFAFVVIQHLDPSQPSHMAKLLTRYTEMKVSEVEDGTRVQANHVYTIPSNSFMLIKEGKLRLTEIVKRDGLRMPIDFFFRSLAEDQRENAIAVLFSGSGSDGTVGIREIRGMAGLVIVQDPKSAQFDSMIQNALATGLVDQALPVQEIPGAILEYVRQHSTSESSRPDSKTTREGIASILNLLAIQTKNDFRCYKPTTIYRRIVRRMGLNRINDIGEYYRFLSEHPDELAKLSKDMLIGVTSFFRDPEAFEELRDKVVASLVEEKRDADPLRAWVAGCATGEEAYSIVMLLMEEMARARKSFRLQVFASDIDPAALKCAREGIYPESIAADLTEERLARFFIKRDATYQIDKQVRDAVTFAPHNLLADPPFLNLELVSCRNLLIYIEPEMQKKILGLFAFALKPSGYLFLGRSENPMEQSEMFEPISKSSRIFRRKPYIAARVAGFAPRAGAPAVPLGRPETQHPRLSDLNQQVLLKHFNASIVLVDGNGEIRHFYGPTHRYLSHPFGDASLSLFEMAENRHALKLRAALDRAARENNSVRLEALEFSRDDATTVSVNVTVTPILERNTGVRLFAFIFEESGIPVNPVLPRAGETEVRDDDSLVARLEADNKVLKEELQATSDSFQTTHEELTAANEEVLAINEELQSTNEELVTSKEELQSVNEELITTNNQLTDKVEELSKINDDLANFLNSSEVGTVFLDRKFCIRRFTPSTTELMNLLPLDVGRPLSHISNKFIDTDLVAIADGVLKTLIPVEKEVFTSEGLWFMLRCLPYRTLSDVIDGVVFTFTDVTRLKSSEEAMMEARDYAENVIHSTREALLVLDSGLRVVSANPAFYQIFQVLPEETEGRLIYELGNHQWDIPELRNLLEKILPTNSMIDDFDVRHNFPNIGLKSMLLNARRIYSRDGKNIRLILLGISDVTERRELEQQRQEFSHELEQKVSARTGQLEQANRALLEDMEERKKLEDQLRQSQKMESMGTLAAGIAHDLNNILNIIQGYTSVLAQDATGDQIAESVEVITQTTKRGSTLVQQLLTLAHKTETQLEPIDVNILIRELNKLIKETFPRNIELKLDLGRHLPLIMADPNQVTQVLLNLSVNARDAMQDGGTITIKTLVSQGEGLQEQSEPKAERYVSIEVTDTGKGMDENIRGRIFEPFFTTKGIGQGTGLGLSVVYGIVKSHNGFIQVESKPMVGTTFRLHFPVQSAGG